MAKNQSIELISPNFDKKINVHTFMKDHYVKIGYLSFSKINFLNKVIKIYITYFRKVRIIVKTRQPLGFKYYFFK